MLRLLRSLGAVFMATPTSACASAGRRWCHRRHGDQLALGCSSLIRRILASGWPRPGSRPHRLPWQWQRRCAVVACDHDRAHAHGAKAREAFAMPPLTTSVSRTRRAPWLLGHSQGVPPGSRCRRRCVRDQGHAAALGFDQRLMASTALCVARVVEIAPAHARVAEKERSVPSAR